MLSLPAPYGWNAAASAHLILRVMPGGFDHGSAGALITDCGCASDLACIAVQRLHYSGRFDCYLQLTWVQVAYEKTIHRFRKVGLDFYIDEWKGGEPWDDHKSKLCKWAGPNFHPPKTLTFASESVYDSFKISRRDT